MRTIKFRGKTHGNGKWYYGSLVYSNEINAALYFQIGRGLIKRLDWVYVIPETIGQFTGLYDCDGTEIYEGDVIGCHNPRIKHLIFYNEKQGRFMAALNGDIENDFGVVGLDDSSWVGSKKVIGNIHDNPELLKGGEE